MKTFIYLLIISISFASCGSQHRATLRELTRSDSKEQRFSNYQMSYDAMRRGSILNVDKDGKINRILSEVQPDAAIATTTDLTNKLSGQLSAGQSVSMEQVTKITETLSKLGERTAPVNMLRDALYRLEEHCINFEQHCQGELYWQSFNTVVSTITKLQEGISQTAKSDTEKAAIELQQLNLFKNMPTEDKINYYRLKKEQ